MDVQSVVRQVGRLRIGIAVRGICPRQRVRIDRIFRSRLVVVEVQSLQHVVDLLYLVVGNQGFGNTLLVFCLCQGAVLAWLVVNQLVTADIEHIVTRVGFYGCIIAGAGELRRPATRTQTII